MQLSQLRRTGFPVGIYKEQLLLPFPVGRAQSRARTTKLYFFEIHSDINTLDQF